MREKTKAALSVFGKTFLFSLIFLPLYIALIVLNGARYNGLEQDIMLLILPVAVIEQYFALKKARKKQRKLENMQRLKEADLLHPKNQRRRVPKGKDKS